MHYVLRGVQDLELVLNGLHVLFVPDFHLTPSYPYFTVMDEVNNYDRHVHQYHNDYIPNKTKSNIVFDFNVGHVVRKHHEVVENYKVVSFAEDVHEVLGGDYHWLCLGDVDDVHHLYVHA